MKFCMNKNFERTNTAGKNRNKEKQKQTEEEEKRQREKLEYERRQNLKKTKIRDKITKDMNELFYFFQRRI